ncbi:MAG TPA: hypothetical protein PKM57_18775 [Kiritimatiellia bacterium]|nr:hypothetical protein [Kiritimatiellia bacterium]HPS09533.1 hypothetical protein [Kiritimatiellia bacterium]
MENYANLSGTSNVEYYSCFPHSIFVRFKDTWLYAYTAIMLGQQAIDEMHALAQAGRGLNSFISRTKPAYANKWFNSRIG